MCKKMPLKMMLQSPSCALGEQGAQFRGEAACASSCPREAPWAPLTLQGVAPVLLPQQSPSRVRLSPAPWGTSPSPPSPAPSTSPHGDTRARGGGKTALHVQVEQSYPIFLRGASKTSIKASFVTFLQI